MNSNVLFSSKSDNWSTPQWLFDRINKIFNFDVDVCADFHNAKCNEFFTLEDDGLSKDWTLYKSVWCNPPYGRSVWRWVSKAYFTSLAGSVVVMLLPARTDTKWFHDYCIDQKIIFIRGRLKFGGCKNSAPFPSMIVIFGDNTNVINLEDLRHEIYLPHMRKNS